MHILALIVMAVVLINCAEEQSSTVIRAEAVSPPTPSMDFVAYKRFDTSESVPWRSVDVEVRLLTKQEALKERPMGTAEGAALGGTYLGLGTGAALLTPMAGGAFVGGAIIFPMAIYFGVQNDIWVERFERAVADVDFPSRIREAMAFKLGQASISSQPVGKPGEYRLEIIVSEYGIVAHCFGFIGTIILRRNDEIAFEDGLYWQHQRRNPDFPPARCASLGEFAEENASLFRQTMIEASAIIAAVIDRRLVVKS